MTEKLKALREGYSFDFIGNDLPKCPHCGEDFDVSGNEAWHLYEEGEHEVECHNPLCEHQFIVSTHVRYSFWTDGQHDLEDFEDDA